MLPFRGPLTTLWASLAGVATTLATPIQYTTGGQIYDVLILGGGVSGIIAAQQLHKAGITDFLIVEARDELGGRMRSFNFGGITLEYGCNWVEGTETPGSQTAGINPIWKLAKKHELANVCSNLEDITFYNETGKHDFSDVYEETGKYVRALYTAAGARFDSGQVDMNARAGFSLVGSNPSNKYAWASEFYHFDWKYAQSPEQSSWIRTSQNFNYTFNPDRGGFSNDECLSVDQRGYKHIIQAEAATFLKPSQVQLSAVVKNIAYDPNGVTVSLASGVSHSLRAKYAITTFSIGVLQRTDVSWTPALPHWKLEAIMSMKMATYTKIFLKFPYKFWADTEMGLYADPIKRGYYTVWQSLDHPRFFKGSGIYFVTAVGDEAERIENLTDAQVQAEVMTVLRKMYPNVTVPDPVAFSFYRWHSDPLYRGSYSNWPASWYLEHLHNLRDPIQTVYFAGEATSYRYFGYLQGAYETGEAVGRQVATCVLRGCEATNAMIRNEVRDENKAIPTWHDHTST